MKSSSESLLISAGEPSGDLLGSEVIREILKIHSELSIFGMAGPRMIANGCISIADMPSVMGLVGPFSKIGTIAGSLASVTKTAIREKPKAALLIDFPDFHMTLARLLKHAGIPVFQLVSPQFWAWRPGRIDTIKKLYEKTFVVLPFEEDIYKRHGAPVEYVGNPVLDRMELAPGKNEARKILGIPAQSLVISLLPGSRLEAVKRNIPVFLKSAEVISRTLKDSVFIISATATDTEEIIKKSIVSLGMEKLFFVSREDGITLVRASDAAIVCSGTATLETTLGLVPHAGVYVTSPITYYIGKRVVKVDNILLANLILGREAIKEFIQENATPVAIGAEIVRLVQDSKYRNEQLMACDQVRRLLGAGGAAARVATTLVSFMNSRS